MKYLPNSNYLCIQFFNLNSIFAFSLERFASILIEKHIVITDNYHKR